MEEITPIYKFDRLRSFLESIGVSVGNSVPYKRVNPGDISIDEKGNIVGDIHLDSDGMLAVDDASGVSRNVFLIKKAFFFEWQGRSSIPKAHLCLCQAILEKKEDYRYANDQPVSVFDRASRRERKVENLELCSYCKKMLRGKYRNVQTIDDFLNIIKNSEDFSFRKNVEVDFAGYVKDWSKISLAYREVKKYRCERCGIDLNDFEGKFYCQVHHMNGNKLDNRESNLQCLCVYCHSQVDERHRENFSSKAQQRTILDFLDYKKKKKD